MNFLLFHPPAKDGVGAPNLLDVIDGNSYRGTLFEMGAPPNLYYNSAKGQYFQPAGVLS